MKKLLSASLALATLISLTACGGQAQIVPTPGYGQQQGYGQSYQNPYMQTGYNYQAPAAQQQQRQQQATAPNLANLSGQLPTAYNPQLNQQFAGQVSAAPQQAMRAPVAVPQQAPAPGVPQQAPQAAPQQAPAPGVPQQAPQAAPPQQQAQTPEAIAQDLLRKTREKFNSMQNFKGIAEVMEKNEKGVTNLKLDVIFQKPGRSKMQILEHPNGMYVGVKLVYDSGQDKVTGRPSGMLGFAKLTVPMTDERILTRRGYRLDSVDSLAIINRLVNDPNKKPKILGKTTMAGNQVAVLEYIPQNHFDPNSTRELPGIGMNTRVVRIHEMYAGKELVYSLKLPQVQMNAPLSAKDFEV